ncbi:hypothetical protein QT716_06410 [Sporosarcina aquimarina]|uniref:Uncharacterized protein n=2 Tax=Sporosarcina aquimarina TaxID=114975 RepID=A0ABU4G203_9BACL|nr:hypothetical protein [Sporosarcina aquimarina]
MNTWLLQNHSSILPFTAIGLVFLAFWAFVGFITSRKDRTLLKSAFITNTTAFIVLLLIVYQEILLEKFWLNLFGTATQFYYLPLFNLSASILGTFTHITTFAIHTWSAALVGFCLLFVSYYIGGLMKKRFYSAKA